MASIKKTCNVLEKGKEKGGMFRTDDIFFPVSSRFLFGNGGA